MICGLPALGLWAHGAPPAQAPGGGAQRYQGPPAGPADPPPPRASRKKASLRRKTMGFERRIVMCWARASGGAGLPYCEPQHPPPPHPRPGFPGTPPPVGTAGLWHQERRACEVRIPFLELCFPGRGLCACIALENSMQLPVHHNNICLFSVEAIIVRSVSAPRPRVVRSLSARCPLGVRSESARCPLVVRSVSARCPLGVRSVSAQCPLSVRLVSAHCPLIVRSVSGDRAGQTGGIPPKNHVSPERSSFFWKSSSGNCKIGAPTKSSATNRLQCTPEGERIEFEQFFGKVGIHPPFSAI